MLWAMGDEVEGVQHHKTRQTFGDEGAQRDLAVRLMMPFVNLADEAVGLLGSDAHTGPGGLGDIAVYKELGISDYGHERKREVNGRIIHAQHHGSTGRQARLWEGSLLRLLRHELDKYNDAVRTTPHDIEPMPDIFLRGHVHLLGVATMHMQGLAAAFTGSWQWPTKYVYKKHYQLFSCWGDVVYP